MKWLWLFIGMVFIVGCSSDDTFITRTVYNSSSTTINNTYYVNITQNSTSGVQNFTYWESGDDDVLSIGLINGTQLSVMIDDDGGTGTSYNDSWIQPALNLKANITQVLGNGVLVEILNGSVGDGVLIEWMITE